MGYKPGKDMLLKVNFGLGGGFQTLGGIVNRRLTLNDTTVDVTNQDSERGWSEMLGGVAPKSMRVSGDGHFKSGPVATQFVQSYLNQQGWGLEYQVILPGLGIFQGPYTIGTFEFSGSESDTLRISIELSSSGQISFYPNTAL